MALATQCPHCGTQFRVAADQLKLRGGIVRCGACQQIFDGNTGLIDLNAPPSSPPPHAPLPPPPADESSPQDQEQPIYTLEFDRALSPFGILPQAAGEEPAPEPEPEPEPAITDMQVDEALVAVALPDDEADGPAPAREAVAHPPAPAGAHDAPPLLLRESAGGSAAMTSSAPAPQTPRTRAAEARARRSRPPPPRSAEPPRPRAPEIDEPEFVRRGRQREQSGKTVRIALAAGSALLLLALVLQAMVSFRDVLAARHPALRPALASTCAVFGCTVALPMRPDALVIETGELITLGANTYTMSTVLRNGGDLALAWPSIELTLNDADDKPLVRRVFGPRDYVPQAAASPAGFGARAEQPVRIHFRLEGLKPSGYHIAVFYP